MLRSIIIGLSLLILSPLTSAQDAPPSKTITLEKIMSDPDWMGRSPTNWYWSADGESILYSQKRVSSRQNDLYLQNLNDKSGTKIALADLHKYATRNAAKSNDNRHIAYSYGGNIFIQSLRDFEITQVTQSSARDSSPQFLSDGSLAFRRNNSFFTLLATNSQ